MPSIEWSHEPSMGVPLIDEQHKQLIALANDLIEAVGRGQGRQAIEEALRRLREYTVFHFNSEEQFMKEMLYDKRGGHALEHRRLKEQVKHYRRSICYKENLNPEAVPTFPQSWPIKHLLKTDRLSANFIHARKNKGKGETSPPTGPPDSLHFPHTLGCCPARSYLVSKHVAPLLPPVNPGGYLHGKKSR